MTKNYFEKTVVQYTPGQVSSSLSCLDAELLVLDCDWLMECFTQRPLRRPAQVPASVGRGSVGAAAPAGVGRDEDGGRYYSTKRGAFHEVFNIPESERPLTGERGIATQA